MQAVGGAVLGTASLGVYARWVEPNWVEFVVVRLMDVDSVALGDFTVAVRWRNSLHQIPCSVFLDFSAGFGLFCFFPYEQVKIKADNINKFRKCFIVPGLSLFIF